MIRINFFSLHRNRITAKKRTPEARRKIRQAGQLFTGVIGVFLAVLVLGINGPAPTTCANSISCAKDLTGSFEPGKASQFMGQSVPLPPSVPENTGLETVLGASTGAKHIYVDLSTQRLTAYEGSKLVFLFPVATGKWGKTPTGDYTIWVKLRYTHMEGGNKDDGTYYNLYNVPYTMFFYNSEVPKSAGFSIHGAYWHNNFGHPMSHGCVNMRPEDAAKIFAWADPITDGTTTYASDTSLGTVVTITGVPPEE